MKILVLEDEQRAGEKVIDLIESVNSEADITWLRTVEKGIEFLSSGKSVDLIFSDIELMDGNVFKVFKNTKVRCPIIFCTAYDRYYVDAFKANGIAYLLKPFTKDQFQEAWIKYKVLFDGNKPHSLPTEIVEELSQNAFEKRKYKASFAIKKLQGVLILKVEDIVYFQSQGDFIIVVDVRNRKHSLPYTLKFLETILNPDLFFKINRSEIVQFQYIHTIKPYIKNRLELILSGATISLYTTNSRASGFKKWVEGH